MVWEGVKSVELPVEEGVEGVELPVEEEVEGVGLFVGEGVGSWLSFSICFFSFFMCVSYAFLLVLVF